MENICVTHVGLPEPCTLIYECQIKQLVWHRKIECFDFFYYGAHVKIVWHHKWALTCLTNKRSQYC
jgi:hypothetical protein